MGPTIHSETWRSPALVGIAVAGSLGCGAILRLATERPDAAWVVPIAIAWGIAVVAGVPRALPLGPVALVAAALLVRAPLVSSPPHLSDDLYRYLWEGLATRMGHDVFREAPASIAGLDDALRAQVNHPEVPTVYPPLALAWFALLSLTGSAAGVQFLTALVDATVPLALRKASGRDDVALIYALHPLAALESAAGAHVDLPAAALGAWALAAWRVDRHGLAFGAAVAGGLVKLFPWLFAPVLLRGLPTKQALAAAVAGTAVIAALCSPWAWGPLPAGPGAYAGSWSFNGLFYPWLAWTVGEGARRALIVAAALAVGLVWWRVREPALAWSLIGTVFLATSPTVHPWYAIWALVPSLALGERRWAWASLPLLGSYLVLWTFDPATGAWSEAPWLWWVTWPPAVALWLAVGQRERRDATPTAP